MIKSSNGNNLQIGFEQISEKKTLLKSSFPDEKIFDMDGVYNTQNDRVWAVDRADANKNGGIQRRRKFPEKVKGFVSMHVPRVSHTTLGNPWIKEQSITLFISKKCFLLL